jgi:phosphate starvation-inducible PhoH-like protein
MSRKQRRASNKFSNSSSALGAVNFKLAHLDPLTDNQEDAFDIFEEPDINVVLKGYAGTGKTMTALYCAFKEIEKGNQRKMVIVRSAVTTRDIGFLPGSEAEKAAQFELPYKQLVNELFGRGDAYEVLKKHGVIEFLLTSNVRGTTIKDAWIVIDEFNNMTAHELSSVISRASDSSRVAICGDILQRDLTRHNEKDVEKVIKVLEKMDNYFEFVEFGVDDIVRSGMLKEFITVSAELYPDGF